MRTNLLRPRPLETEMNQHDEAILDQPIETNPWTRQSQPKWAGLPRQPLQMHKKLTVTVSSAKVMGLVAAQHYYGIGSLTQSPLGVALSQALTLSPELVKEPARTGHLCLCTSGT